MNKNNIKRFSNIFIICMVFVISFSIIGMKEYEIIQLNNSNNLLQTSSNSLSDKKIEWGIKRGDNHEQPDLGSENERIIEENNGICMGNSEKPYVYLTFDCGYEAGYTEKIL